MAKGLRGVLLMGALIAGIVCTLYAVYVQYTNQGYSARAYITNDVSVTYDGQQVSQLSAYQTNTPVSKVKRDCHNKVLPSIPGKTGNITEPVIRLDVSGKQLCIVSSESEDVAGITVLVRGVSNKRVSDSALSGDIPDTYYSELELSKNPPWGPFALQGISTLLLGIGLAGLTEDRSFRS